MSYTTDTLVRAIAIGVLAFGALYLSLDVAFPTRDETIRRVKLIFAGAGYFLVTWSLVKDPHLLQEISRRLTWEIIGILFALLILLRAALRRL